MLEIMIRELDFTLFVIYFFKIKSVIHDVCCVQLRACHTRDKT